MPDLGRSELLRDHAVIESLAKRLATLIDGDAGATELSLTLGHLVRVVADHLAVEDSIIYSLAMQAQPGTSAQDVESARDDFECLKAGWGEFLNTWTPEQVAANREGFVSAARAMLPRLRQRVDLETKLLFLMGPRELAPRSSQRAHGMG